MFDIKNNEPVNQTVCLLVELISHPNSYITLHALKILQLI